MLNNFLNKPLVAMTGAELLNLLKQFNCPEVKAPEVKNPELPQFVTGIKGLAGILGVSVSTVNRMKAEGVLDGALFQNGKTVIFDVHKVFEILKVCKKN